MANDAQLADISRSLGRLEGALDRLLDERDEDNKRRAKQWEKVDGLTQGMSDLRADLVNVQGTIKEMTEPLSRFKRYERRGFFIFGCVMAAAAVTGAAVDDVAHWVGKGAGWVLRIGGY